MEQESSVNSPLTSSKLLLIIVGSVFVAALVSGGGVYAYQKNQSDKTQADLQSQIDTLKSQARVVKAPVATLSPIIPTTQPTDSPTPTTSNPTLAPAATSKTYTSTNTQLRFQYPSSWFVREDISSKRTYLSNYAGAYDKTTSPANYELIWLSINPNDTDSVAGSDGTNSKKFQSASVASASSDQVIAGDEVIGIVTHSTIGNADAYLFTTTGGVALVAYGTMGHGFNYGGTISTERGSANQAGEVNVLKQVLASAVWAK